MPEFDPDAYLAGGTAAVAEPPPFNPDAYLNAPGFDPDAYLHSDLTQGEQQSTTPVSDQAVTEGADTGAWRIQPGSLPDRILTWFGGGPEAMKKAEEEIASGRIRPGERPPGAMAVAKGIDALTGLVGVPPVMENLVSETTAEPKPGETSFTNLGIPQFGPQEGTGKQIAAGLANVPIGFANFLLSPGGVTTVQGLGLLPKLAQTLVGIGFTADQVKEFIGAKTLQERVSSGVGAVLLGTGTAMGARARREAELPASYSDQEWDIPTTQGGETNAVQIPSANAEVPRATEAGQNQPGGGGGVGPGEQGPEAPGAPESQAAAETPVETGAIAPETPEVAPQIFESRARPEETLANAAAQESVGPGAASIAEPLASYELRRFGERFQEDQGISPEIRAETGNRYYEPIPNTTTVADAENIIERRGTDESIRLIRDPEFQMEPRIRVTIGEALIKKLNQSHQEAMAMGNEVHADEFLQQAVDTAEYLSEYGTTLGQGVQAFAIWNKLTPEGRLLEATRIAKKSGVELTPEQIRKISELNAEIEKAPEGFQKDEKTQDLLAHMAELKGANPADIPTALWYSNILSGYSTQLVNTIDTSLNVLSEAGAMAASHPSRVPEILSGLYQGLVKGGFEAANVLRTGRSISGDKISQQRILELVKFGEKGGVPLDIKTPLGRFMKRAFEAKPAKILNLWKYPLRAMVASDTTFYHSMKEARARFLARGLAKTEGLSGDRLFKRVDEILNQSPEAVRAATRQAEKEGLSGLRLRRRVNEIAEQGRPPELVDSSREAAQIATYNHDPSGVLGLVAHNISNITQAFPLAKAVVPFTRIVANVANRGLNYTPWGYKRLFFGEWGGKKFASEAPTGEAYRAQLVKATLGTAAMTTVAALDANDTIQVTARGPDDPEHRKQLMNAGWKPYSVKIGDTYYSYQYTPFALGFAMIGHYRDAVRYNKLSEKDASTRLAYGMLKSGSTIFDMSFLSGLSDFISTIQGATSSTKGVGRMFARTASSVVIPNLVKQVDKLFDPTVYQGDTVTEALIRETPVARSLALKPMLNVLGEPIRPSQNRFFTSKSDDPVWQFIVDNQAWVPVPSKTSKIGNRPITPEEYYTLIEKSGPKIRRYISSNLNTLRRMTAEDAHKAIRKQSEDIRDAIKRGFKH